MRLQIDRISTIGLFLTAIVSPCCFPLFGILLTAFGLGSFELFGSSTMWVFQGFVVLSLAGTAIAYRQHRKAGPLVIALISAGLIFWSYHFVDADYWTWLLYTGMFGLMGSAILNYLATRKQQREAVVLRSVLTCPHCGHSREEAMPENACTYFYVCTGCNTRLKPLGGDCCVFCSYGTVKCPPVQAGTGCC